MSHSLPESGKNLIPVKGSGQRWGVWIAVTLSLLSPADSYHSSAVGLPPDIPVIPGSISSVIEVLGVLLDELPAPHFNLTEDDRLCINVTQNLISAIEDPQNNGALDMEATQLFDSWGTSIGDPGKYRQCIADSNKYCEVKISAKSLSGDITYMSGVCFPSQCTRKALQSITTQIVKGIIPSESVTQQVPNLLAAVRQIMPLRKQKELKDVDGVVFDGIYCSKVETVWDSTGAISICAFVFLTACVVIVASMIDSYGCCLRWHSSVSTLEIQPLLIGSINSVESPKPSHSPKRAVPSQWRRLILTLSAHRSWKTLSGPARYCRELRVFDGLKVISLCWVMSGQTMLTIGGFLDNEIFAVRDIQQDIQFQIVLNSSLATDTFLLISGFLSTHIVLHRFATRGHAPSGKGAFFLTSTIFLRRILRMTPLLAIVLVIYTQLLPVVIQGPFASAWQEHSGYASCASTWWTNIMYVNNPYPPDVQFNVSANTLGCMGWYWYAAVDMQLFILGPIMAFLFWHYGSKAIYAVLFLIAVCIGANAWIVTKYHITVCTSNVLNWASPQLLLINKPWTRATPHLLGILLAFFFNAVGEDAGLKGIPIPATITRSLLFALSTTLLLTPIFGTYNMRAVSSDETMFAGQCSWSIVSNDLYLVLFRASFSFGLFLLVTLCMIGWIPWVTSVLSLQFWTPLSRLVFGAYLVHPILVEVLVYGGDRKLNFTSFSWLVLYAGFILMSFIASAAMYLLWESPLNQQRRSAIRL